MPDPAPQSSDQNSKHKFSDYFYNRITYFGAFLAVFFFIAECVLFGYDFLNPHGSIYQGLITYMILPPFLIIGLILIPLGALWKRKQVASGRSSRRPRSLYIDPSVPQHRNAVIVFTVGTVILVIMTVIGTYQAFHYSESVEFCGTLCHTVMEPEHTTYLQSPHARVKCVECHIGPGASWYVKSKMSGLRQVFKTMAGTYPKPVPSPVHNLRPAKETCERCHWPGKSYGSYDFRRTYFPRDVETSGETPWKLRMMVQTGRSESEDYGIHAHMYVDNDIYYVAEDEKRQNITWVKSVHKDGTEEIYTSPDSAYKDQSPPEEKIRKMDCIDCHNRPTHHYEAPYELANMAFQKGLISEGIPEFKPKMLEVMGKEYESKEKAVTSIPQELKQYYQENHADYYAENKNKVDTAISQVVVLFQSNIFPNMKARWDDYPNNIGHMLSPGCFRCHDDEHESAAGEVISKDCDLCHSIVEQGPAGQTEKSLEGLEFRHPFDNNELWTMMNCYDCHVGY